MKIQKFLFVCLLSVGLLLCSGCGNEYLTAAPTEAPTVAPTEAPTVAPTEAPTVAPTEVPTVAPTEIPTAAPTEIPTVAPTEVPTVAPTEEPTEAPKDVTAYTPGLSFRYDGDSYAVSGYTGTDFDVIIPSSYQGLPVKSIAAEAFANCETLLSVSIPASVVRIEGEYSWNGSFYCCVNLASVIFRGESQLNELGAGSFCGCKSLTKFECPASVTKIGDSCFRGCSNLKEFTWKNESRLTAIGQEAFCYCDALESMTVPKNVTQIGMQAFYSCDSLSTVWLESNGPLLISYGAFQFCRSLQRVFYSGTANDWQQIVISPDSDDFVNATRYYYSESSPEDYGSYWHYDEIGMPVIWQ